MEGLRGFSGRGDAGPLREWGGTCRRDRSGGCTRPRPDGARSSVAGAASQPDRVVTQAEDDPVPVRAAPGACTDLSVDDERLLPGHHQSGHLLPGRHPQVRRQEVGRHRFLRSRSGCVLLGGIVPRLRGLQLQEQRKARTLGLTKCAVLASASKKQDLFLSVMSQAGETCGCWERLANKPHTSGSNGAEVVSCGGRP